MGGQIQSLVLMGLCKPLYLHLYSEMRPTQSRRCSALIGGERFLLRICSALIIMNVKPPSTLTTNDWTGCGLKH